MAGGHVGRVTAVVACLTFAAIATPGAAGERDQPDGRYRGFGDPGGFLNIIPPGQDASLTSEELGRAQAANDAGDLGAFPPHFADQQVVYERLAFSGGDVAPRDLDRYFKDASFGVRPGDVDRVYEPHRDATVIRDKAFGVPHVFGRTRYATMFAEGYTTAEDRILFMDVLRNLGRGRLSELVGAPLLEMDLDTLRSSPYTEEDLEAQIGRLRRSGRDGAAAVKDLEAYTDGVNGFLEDAGRDPARLPVEYALLGKEPEPWRVTDAVAIAALVGGLFGRGGGRELDNLCGLDDLGQRIGDAGAAREVFDDLHFADSPEAPTTSHRRAPYNDDLGPVDAGAVPALDCASLRPIGPHQDSEVLGASGGLGGGGLGHLEGLLGGLAPRGRVTPGASNALLVGGDHTESGQPIAVFGPQVGYQVPAILVEKDVHGPGIDARGVGFLGVDAYVLLGRGRDYAWSATSSGADNVDTFVLRLCDPAGGTPTVDSTGYEHDGDCEPIEAFEHVIDTTTGLGGGDPVTFRLTIERARDYGPISRRGTLTDGTPIAVAQRRSTYLAEIDSAVGFRRLNDPEFMERGVDAFRDATGRGIHFTFNWFYVDGEHIAYQHSCRCPRRAPGVDPDLPAFGTGEWDWRGFVGFDGQPHDSDPPAGYISSWNNKQAPGFRSSDGEFSYGPVQRVQLLDDGIERAIDDGTDVDRAAVVGVTADAATADLRGRAVVPLALEVMRGRVGVWAGSRLPEARDLLAAWVDDGAHRRDADHDGSYEHATALAVIDAWWPELTKAIFGPAGEPFEVLDVTVDDAPGSGSAWNDGSYSHVQHDLRLVLGRKVRGGWRDAYCGRAAGGPEECARLLWESLAAALAALEAELGSPDPAAWQRTPADDEIEYTQLLVGVPPMQWVNRPTFQQVVEVGADRG